MLFSKKDKVFLAIATALLFISVVLLATVLTSGFQSSKNRILQGTTENALSPITEDDLNSEYESRDPYLPENLANIGSIIMDRLSCAAYNDLDSYLERLYFGYRDGEGGETGLDVSYKEMIDMYRSDLASIQSITGSEDPPVNLSNYFYPETLASAFIYSTISSKIDAVLDRSSIMLPAVKSGYALETNLRVVDMTNEQILDLLEDVKGRLPWLNIIGVAQYDFHAFRTEFRITLVCLNNYLWSVASVDCLNEEFETSYLTIDQLKEFESRAYASGQREFDYDSFYQIAQ